MEAGAVIETSGFRPAAEPREAAQKAEAAAFGLDFAVERAASGVAHDIDDAAGGMAAVDRRSGPAQDFDALGPEQDEVLEERRCVALGRGGVAEAETVHRDGGVLRAEAASDDAGEGAGPPSVWTRMPGSERRDSVTENSAFFAQVGRVESVDGFGDFVGGLRRSGRGDDDFGADFGEVERQVESRGGSRQG